MKKILAFILTVFMISSLAACGSTQPKVEASASPATATSAAPAETTPSAQAPSATGNSSITLPIMDEIQQSVTVGASDSSKTAVKMAVKMLDWGTNTGLDPEEIRSAAVAWLMDKGNDEQVAFAEKLTLVDEAYKKLLGDGAKDLLASAGCQDTTPCWGNQPVESIEAIMNAVGLR